MAVGDAPELGLGLISIADYLVRIDGRFGRDQGDVMASLIAATSRADRPMDFAWRCVRTAGLLWRAIRTLCTPSRSIVARARRSAPVPMASMAMTAATPEHHYPNVDRPVQQLARGQVFQSEQEGVSAALIRTSQRGRSDLGAAGRALWSCRAHARRWCHLRAARTRWLQGRRWRGPG